MDDRELLMNAYRIYGAEGLRRLAKILNNKCMKELGLKYGDCMRSPVDVDTDYCIECTIRCIEEECLRRNIKSQLSSNMLIMVNIVDFNPNVKIETDRLNIQIEEYYSLMNDINEMNEKDLNNLKRLVNEDYEYLSSLDI